MYALFLVDYSAMYASSGPVQRPAGISAQNDLHLSRRLLQNQSGADYKIGDSNSFTQIKCRHCNKWPAYSLHLPLRAP